MTNVNEDGVGAAPTNSVAGVAGTGDTRLPTDQREPGVKKKKNYVLLYLKHVGYHSGPGSNTSNYREIDADLYGPKVHAGCPRAASHTT